MKRRALFALCLAVVGCLASGCAVSRVAGHERTTVLGGLVAVSKNDYTPPENNTLTVDSATIGRGDEPTGTKTTLFWGLLTYTNY